MADLNAYLLTTKVSNASEALAPQEIGSRLPELSHEPSNYDLRARNQEGLAILFLIALLISF
jgi:hypothetical protein